MIDALGSQLDPSRELAQDWARRELSDPAYAQARPGWVERLAQWIIDRLRELQVPDGLTPGRSLGTVLLVLLVVLVAAVVLRRTGLARRGARAATAGAVLDGERLTAAEHRRRADKAATEGRFDIAVRERFRAVARSLEERAVLQERPGRTADEIAVEAGRAMPVTAGSLRSAAEVFDDVWYGGRTATAAHDAQLRELDRAVTAARPVLEPTTVGPLP